MAVRSDRVAVGVRRVVAYPARLEVHVAARRRPDRRGALERQADIRAGRDRVEPAPRRLLPATSEGMDLRLGWLTGPDRASWTYPQATEEGDGLDAMYEVPLTESLVLAWPVLGMPETVVPVPLPAGGPVEDVSVWDAPAATPLDAPPGRPAEADHHRTWLRLAGELGTVVAGPLVLAGGRYWDRTSGLLGVNPDLRSHRLPSMPLWCWTCPVGVIRCHPLSPGC